MIVKSNKKYFFNLKDEGQHNFSKLFDKGQDISIYIKNLPNNDLLNVRLNFLL